MLATTGARLCSCSLHANDISLPITFGVQGIKGDFVTKYDAELSHYTKWKLEASIILNVSKKSPSHKTYMPTYGGEDVCLCGPAAAEQSPQH